MTQLSETDLHADLSGDLEYKACIERLMTDNANILGAAILNLATGESLVAGEFTDAELHFPRVSFSSHPAEEKNAATMFSADINEWVLRIDGEYIVTCGSPGNRQFFLVIEEAEGGLKNAVKSMETLIGQGAEALLEKGGHGAILDRDQLANVGNLANTEISGNSDANGSQRALLALYGLNDDGAAAELMQKLVDKGATLYQVQAAGTGGSWGYKRLPFAPAHIVALHIKGQCPPVEMEKMLRRLRNDVLRRIIFHILDSDGFTADTELPATDAEFNKIIEQLRALPANDLIGRLVIGGFANHSKGEVGEMDDGAMVLRCRECIYYLPHQRWCDLPELPLPVEPDWYCKLWKL